MMAQQKVKPFRPSDFWADGIAMRSPPPGVVPAKGWQPAELVSGVGPDGAPVQRIPLKVTPALLDVGRKKYEVNCALCHGLLSGWDIAECVRYANAAGAIVAGRLMCADDMPTPADLEALVGERHAAGR